MQPTKAPLVAQHDAAHLQLAPTARASAEHPAERLEALAAGRAEAYKLEVEELRVTVARAHLKIQQQQEMHAKEMANVQAELEARTRGEMLARTRCEAAEAELRSLRREAAKLREAAKSGTQAHHEAVSKALVETCKAAMHGLARHGLGRALVGWRMRALRDGLSRWQRLMARRDAERALAEADGARAAAEKAKTQTARAWQQASWLARAEAAALEQPDGPEACRRDRQRAVCARRLGLYLVAEERHAAVEVLREWRLAVCAAAAEDDLREVAGRLRSAQTGMVQLLDGRASAETSWHRHVALARLVVGVAALRTARREGRARKWDLHAGFRPWLLLVAHARQRDAAYTQARLPSDASRDAATADAARKADALQRDVNVLRNNLAAAHKRVRDAGAEADAADARCAKAEEAKEKADALARLARVKAEGLEREKFAASRAARAERQTALLIRRGVVAMAMRGALRRGDELRLASAIARWAIAALQSERGAPWWGSRRQ